MRESILLGSLFWVGSLVGVWLLFVSLFVAYKSYRRFCEFIAWKTPRCSPKHSQKNKDITHETFQIPVRISGKSELDFLEGKDPFWQHVSQVVDRVKASGNKE